MPKGLKIGSAVAIVGLVAFLFWRIIELRDSNADKTQKIYELEWLNAAKQAENDTLKAMGEYAIPDTIWDSIPVPYAVYDTVTGDSVIAYKKVPWAKLVGSIKIDTTKQFGPHGNLMSIRVAGQFWYPAEYSSRNWLLIHPVAGTPYKPMAPRSKSWGIGLVYIRSANVAYSGDYLGASVAYKRLILTGAYDPWRKGGIGGFGLKVLGF